MSRPLGAVLAVATVAAVLAAPAGAEERTAVVVAAGSAAGRQVVALGRDAVVAGRAADGVVALDGSVAVTGTVEGDVIALDGNVEVAATGRVDGDVFVLGGEIELQPGATVTGRTVAYPLASGALLVLAEGPALGLAPWSRVVVGGKLALLAAWVLTALLLVATAARGVLGTAEAVAREPLRCFLVGCVATVALILSATFFGVTLGVLVGVPTVVLLVLIALVLKLWGMVGIFAGVGRALLRSRRPTLLAATLAGLALLGFVKLLPWVGTWAWTAATLVGIGATLATKFGSHEAWFEAS